MSQSNIYEVKLNEKVVKENAPLPMQVVKRDSIPSISTITVEGKKYNLGQLHDFRKNTLLDKFIPEYARISTSWVKLKQGEVLEPHMHPTASLIIICEGEGQVIGDCQQVIMKGDSIIVPPNNLHGFIGGGNDGFWALSIQFEGNGLYEDRSNPRVKFQEGENDKKAGVLAEVEKLIAEQQKLEKRFEKNPLMRLAHSKQLDDPKVRKRLLDALNCWSNWFQKILAARVSVEEESKYFDAAGLHLQEEIGHNKILFGMRNNKPVTFWDPLLDSAASWFHHQMLTGTDHERTVLMHFVMEGSSTLFHSAAKDFFRQDKFFELHSTLDEEHFAMGVTLLQESDSVDSQHLITVLNHGWSVFSVIAAQMANHATGKLESQQ